MSTYATEEFRCPVCGTAHTARIPTSYFSAIPRDLDTYPHVPQVFELVVLCPNCGYATQSPSRPVSEKLRAYINSDEYQAAFAAAKADLPLHKHLLAAMADRHCNNFGSAGLYSLTAAWLLRQRGEDDSVPLSNAIDDFFSHLEFYPEPEIGLILLDCLRRAGDFETAQALANSLSGAELKDFPARVLSFQKQLIAEKDIVPHSMAEVPV